MSDEPKNLKQALDEIRRAHSPLRKDGNLYDELVDLRADERRTGMNRHTEMLILYNQWRRGEIEQLDFTPKEIGESIDAVLEEWAEMLDALEMGISTKTANEAVRRCAEDVARYVVAKAKGEWPKESRGE